jgi:glycosyltransferase involved in cell wall biosynthesis
LNELFRRVLVLIPTLNVGGAETDLLRVLPGLDRSRFKIMVWPFLEGGRLAPQFEMAGLPLVPPLGLARRKSVSASLTGSNFMAASWWRKLQGFPTASWNVIQSAMQVARFVRENQVDVIHAILPSAYLLASIAKPLAGSPRLIVGRMSQNFYHREQPLFGWIERKFLHRFPEIIVGNSQIILDELGQEGVSPARLKLIYNGIEVGNYSGQQRSIARRNLGLSDRCLAMTVIANLFAYKGHTDLLQALAAVDQKLKHEWILIICGRDVDDNQRQLMDLAMRLGLSDRIRFLGERHDIPLILAAADIHISASRTEGFPNNILEAMAAGLPVISTSVGGVVEQIENEQTGLLVQPQDSGALAGAIVRLASDANLRARLGEAAKERAVRLFPLKTAIEAYEDLYTVVTSRN